jgi:hypothetical protein
MAIQLSEPARDLLLAACKDPSGLILKLTASDGSAVLKTNGRTFANGCPGAEHTRWESGIRQLLRFGFVEAQGGRGQVFCITPEGYEAANALWGRR